MSNIYANGIVFGLIWTIMKKQLKVLITGATGRSGGAAVGDLLKMGTQVRALVHRTDERSEKLAAEGAEIMVGDLLSFDVISAALKGIDSAYFCFPILIPGILQATAYFVQAAREAGLKAIVNMSQVSARRDAKSNAAQDHWIGERIFDMSGIPVTHLRPTFFADWFLYVREGIRQTEYFPALTIRRNRSSAEHQQSLLIFS